MNYVSTGYSGLAPRRRLRGIISHRDIPSDLSIYLERVANRGTSINQSTVNALDAFIKGCIFDGIWDLMLDVGPLCGNDLECAKIKIKSFDPSIWLYTNNNFAAADYTESTGLKGNGVSTTLSSEINATTLTSGQTGLAVYDRTTENSTVNLHGAIVGSDRWGLYSSYSDHHAYSDMYDGAHELASSSTFTSVPVGFIHAVRNTGPTHKIYRNGSSIGSTTSVGGNLPNGKLTFFGYHDGSSYVASSAHSLAFVCITAGMNDTQAAALYTRVQAFQTALGRQV